MTKIDNSIFFAIHFLYKLVLRRMRICLPSKLFFVEKTTTNETMLECSEIGCYEERNITIQVVRNFPNSLDTCVQVSYNTRGDRIR